MVYALFDPKPFFQVKMTGPSKKRDQPQSASSQLDGGPPPASEAEVEVYFSFFFCFCF